MALRASAAGYRSGRLFRVADDGLGYLQDAQTGRCFPFRFDRILQFRGETAGALRLRQGRRVRFRLAPDSTVEQVVL